MLRSAAFGPWGPFPDMSSLGSLLDQELWTSGHSTSSWAFGSSSAMGRKTYWQNMFSNVCLSAVTSLILQANTSLSCLFLSVCLICTHPTCFPTSYLMSDYLKFSLLHLLRPMPLPLPSPSHPNSITCSGTRASSHLLQAVLPRPFPSVQSASGWFRVPEKFPRTTCQVETSGRFHLAVRLQWHKMNLPGARINIRDSRWTWLLVAFINTQEKLLQGSCRKLRRLPGRALLLVLEKWTIANKRRFDIKVPSTCCAQHLHRFPMRPENIQTAATQ